MSTKPNLTALLAETGGSARHKTDVPEEPRAPKSKPSPKPKKKSATSAITVHFPKQVRDQLKILAIQNGNTLHGIVAEAFNDFFAKHGKAEIAPKDAGAIAE
jgi:outer membrane biosynthesis protein TonB